MNFLVVGCGSIGQRHIRNLKILGHQVIGCEIDSSRIKRTRRMYGIKILGDLKEALKREYDGAFVCTPTSLHIPISIEIAKRGVHLFIEKPLSDNLKYINELLEIITSKRQVSFVGCNIRFLPSFKRTKKLLEENKIGKVLSVKGERGYYLPYWRPKQDYRKVYSAKRKLGGGVILDDIHDIDLLYWLFNEVKEVFCYTEKISNLKINTEDIAEIFLRFRNGVIAQIHLDYLQRTYRSYYEFIGEKGIILWDYIKQKVELYSEKADQWKVYQDGINTTHEIMYINEIKHFVNCIKGREKPINPIADAKRVLEIALTCHESARKRELVYI